MRRSSILVCAIGAFVVSTGGVFGQAEDMILIDDFEGEWMTWSPNGQYIDYAQEQVHGGEWSMIVEYDQSGSWQYCQSNIPEPLDFSVHPTMDFHVWVYWEDGWAEDEADIRLDVGPAILGHQTAPVANEWVELIWTADRYTTPLLGEVSNFGWFFDPQDASAGVLYVDDFWAGPSALGEWEETLIYGWNDENLDGWVLDLDNLDEGEIFFTREDPAPEEGVGCIGLNYIGDYRHHTSKTIFDAAAGIKEVDLTQYQQMVISLYMQGTQPGWGQATLSFKVWGGTDEPDADVDYNWIGQQTKRVTGAMDRWITILWDYDPENFVDNYEDPNGRIDFCLVTHADPGIFPDTWIYFDNLRLARPVGVSVHDWPIY